MSIIRFRSPRVGGPLSQSLAMIPPTMHGHEFNQPLSRVVMVRKTDQRTFSKGRRGGEPLLETVTRETVELFNGGRAERKYTSETRDIVTPKSNRYVSFSLNYYRLKGKSERNPRLPGTQMKCYVRRACLLERRSVSATFAFRLSRLRSLPVPGNGQRLCC